MRACIISSAHSCAIRFPGNPWKGFARGIDDALGSSRGRVGFPRVKKKNRTVVK